MPQFTPFANKMKLAGVIEFSVHVFIWLIALIALFQRKRETLRGDARFAGGGDLRKARLLKQTP